MMRKKKLYYFKDFGQNDPDILAFDDLVLSMLVMLRVWEVEKYHEKYQERLHHSAFFEVYTPHSRAPRVPLCTWSHRVGAICMHM